MSETSTTLRADVNPKFKFKFLLIGLAALVVGIYHFYDPIFVYPNMEPASQAYGTMKEQFSGDDGAFEEQWKEYAKSKGWPEKPPKYSVSELKTNTIYSYFIGVLFTFVAGIPCLLTFVRCLGQWIESDESSLTNAKGQKVSFAQIKKIDKTKWEKKGIAKLIYDDGGGEKTFVIDDLKFDREVTDQMMELVETRVGEDKIVGGKSESEYRRLREEALREREERFKEEEQEELAEEAASGE